MKQNVLVVDDEKITRNILRQALEESGFSVLEAESGKDALKIVRDYLPALTILDLNLLDISGLDVCAAIKNDKLISHVPIIVLTGEDEEGRNISCLDQGADDYMIKPFDWKEVVARVKAVLRRVHYAGGKQEIIRKNGISIDVGRRAVVMDDKIVIENLTPKEFDLLSLLVQNSPNLLSREFLTKKVWDCDEQIVHERTIDVHIRRIRFKLGPKILSRLLTVPGTGYKFV